MGTQAVLHRMSRLKLRIASYRYSLLLCSQFAIIVIAPLVEREEYRPSPLFTVFALTLFLTALNLVIHKRRLRALAFVLFAAAVLTSLLSAVGFEHVFLVSGIICSMMFMVFMIAVILSELITATTVTREILYGAVSAYMFIGIAWGMAYFLVALLAPGCIVKTIYTKHPLVWTDFTFFSFTTLTTVGYGNMVPVGAVRGLALLQAVIGAMYPPIMIGRLLTLLPKSKRVTGGTKNSLPFLSVD
jgi:voltage-gated potassium channel